MLRGNRQTMSAVFNVAHSDTIIERVADLGALVRHPTAEQAPYGRRRYLSQTPNPLATGTGARQESSKAR